MRSEREAKLESDGTSREAEREREKKRERERKKEEQLRNAWECGSI